MKYSDTGGPMRASAMNNLEYVRKCMRIRRTPNDAGTKLTIEFTYYDNGLVSINGSPKGNYTPDETERWLASPRLVMQMIEKSRNYIKKSKPSAAAKSASEALGRQVRCRLPTTAGKIGGGWSGWQLVLLSILLPKTLISRRRFAPN